MSQPRQEKANTDCLAGQQFTLTPVEITVPTRDVTPIWVRLPKSGKRCPHTGLSRSMINSLILGPNAPVKSVSLKKRYAARGARLVHLPSLLEFIESQVSTHNKQQNND